MADPCSALITQNPTVIGSGTVVGFCWNGKDINGEVATASQFIINVDGAEKFKGPLTPVSPANAQGLSYYEVELSVTQRGNHNVTIAVETVDGRGAFSAPFVFAVVGSLPSTVMNVRVRGIGV